MMRATKPNSSVSLVRSFHLGNLKRPDSHSNCRLEKGGTKMSTVLGDKIRRLRKEKGYSLDKLAELSESSKSYIWELENKNPPRPSADKLAKIADQLDTTIEYLLDEGEALSSEDAADAKFYRQYRQMDETTRAKIRKMVKLWGEDS